MKEILYIKRFLILGFLIIAGVCVSVTQSFATHLRAGNILVKKVNNNCLEYEITVVVFTNTNGTSVLFGGDQDYLNFGDGSGIILIPEIGPGTTVPGATYEVIDGVRGIAKATYTVRHIYRGAGRFTISYIEPNRNAGIVNIDQSVNVTFYIETQILIDPFLGCSSPPDLLVDPIDMACSGAAWFHNPGAQDNEGDRLTYELVQPFRDRGAVVPNYRDPNSPEFYTDYETGNELDNGRPTFKIDSTGTITWDAPGLQGEYNIAFIIIEWRLVRGVWYRMGFVRRDMQIIVEDDCNNKRPDLEVPEKICVVAGETINEVIKGTDPDGDRVTIEAFSNIFELSIGNLSPATLSPDPPILQNTPATANFQWKTTCQHVQEEPYNVVFRVKDEMGLVSYKTMLIQVVGPPPTWNDISLTKRTATIKWDPYFCQSADSIQIWRKVDGSGFVPDDCVTGMPDGLGYQRIANVLVKNGTVFIDNNKGDGLAPGATYCYRLVAVYSSQLGGESLVSLDTCIGPIPIDVPVITNVSITETSDVTGKIKVKWTKPFDANIVLYPPPYTYAVYRATGFARGNDSTLVTTLTPAGNPDTVSIMDIGLNTRDNIYNYTVTATASDGDVLGTSAVASSVRLEASAEGVEAGEVQLTWAAAVPWSNQLGTYPRHLIYRGDAGSTEADLILIDSVDVTLDGFVFLDEGLVESQEYCYKILTRGGYGNPQIDEPLLNFSQIICVEPGDDVPPCTPVLTVDKQDCNNPSTILSLCATTEFSNNISWNLDSDPSCQSDVKSIRIYRSIHGNEYVLLAEVQASLNSYLDKNNLDSYAACYKIAAVDRSGNESEWSAAMCNDNCPYYELPNVFTPNGDQLNDVFSAYNVRDLDCGGEECSGYELELILKCARFVEEVKFKAYNRWGQEVYEYAGTTLVTGPSANSIYIDWDGRDKDGSKLPNGVYYYIAEVTFTTSNPDERVKTLKGWIHLLYDVDRNSD